MLSQPDLPIVSFPPSSEAPTGSPTDAPVEKQQLKNEVNGDKGNELAISITLLRLARAGIKKYK